MCPFRVFICQLAVEAGRDIPRGSYVFLRTALNTSTAVSSYSEGRSRSHKSGEPSNGPSEPLWVATAYLSEAPAPVTARNSWLTASLSAGHRECLVSQSAEVTDLCFELAPAHRFRGCRLDTEALGRYGNMRQAVI